MDDLTTNFEHDVQHDFAAHLNGKDTFELLTNLQNFEIKLLEQIENYLSKRLHIDLEYYEKLSKFHQKVPLPDEKILSGSNVKKVN